MSIAQQSQPISVEDYLRGEAGAQQKHEYIDGSVYLMAGASNNHNLIATNVTAELHSQLRGKPCRVFNSDAKIRIHNSNDTRFYYPDLSVVCQPNSANDSYHDSPVVIVEVVSASTRRTDEYEKRESYLTIESLRVYILVEQKVPAALVYRRRENRFASETYLGLDSVIPLPEIECNVALADIYANAVFPSAEQVREQQEHFQLTGELPVEFVF
jgi:Uma2 family endonuclease